MQTQTFSPARLFVSIPAISPDSQPQEHMTPVWCTAAAVGHIPVDAERRPVVVRSGAALQAPCLAPPLPRPGDPPLRAFHHMRTFHTQQVQARARKSQSLSAGCGEGWVVGEWVGGWWWEGRRAEVRGGGSGGGRGRCRRARRWGGCCSSGCRSSGPGSRSAPSSPARSRSAAAAARASPSSASSGESESCAAAAGGGGDVGPGWRRSARRSGAGRRRVPAHRHAAALGAGGCWCLDSEGRAGDGVDERTMAHDDGRRSMLHSRSRTRACLYSLCACLYVCVRARICVSGACCCRLDDLLSREEGERQQMWDDVHHRQSPRPPARLSLLYVSATRTHARAHTHTHALCFRPSPLTRSPLS